MPFIEGSRDLTCARTFHLKTEIKKCFERWLFFSTTGNGVLAIFHTKQLESGSEFLKMLAQTRQYLHRDDPSTRPALL
jgi:hypothetical protein